MHHNAQDDSNENVGYTVEVGTLAHKSSRLRRFCQMR